MEKLDTVRLRTNSKIVQYRISWTKCSLHTLVHLESSSIFLYLQTMHSESTEFAYLIVTKIVKKVHTFYETWKFNNRVNKSPVLDPILSHINPVHIVTLCFYNIHSSIILLFTPRSSEWSLSSMFSHHKFVYNSRLFHAYYISRPISSSLILQF